MTRPPKGENMKLKNQNGFFHLIAYLLIFIIFVFTIYACLDILNLIEVPKEYSVSEWLSQHTNETKVEEIEDFSENLIESLDKHVRIEIENTSKPSKTTNFDMSQITGYQPSATNTNKNSTKSEFLYYTQLDDYAKIMYQELEKNLDNMKSGTYNVQFGKTFDDLLHQENGEEILNQSFQLAINALNFDKPDLFYLDVSKIYLLTKIKTKLWATTYEVEIGSSQGQSYLNPSFADETQVEQAIRMVENEKQKIKVALSGNTENQIKGVHDYLVDQLDYDSSLSAENIYNIYGALINKYTVCEGYARSFKYLMDDLGIPCLIACGIAVNSSGEAENHAWNYVQMNGQWYAIDVTWDDPVIVGNGYVSKSVNYKYYLKGSDEFFTNHREDGNIVGNSNFKYPILSPTNY